MEQVTLYINGVLDRVIITDHLDKNLLDDILTGIETDQVAVQSFEYKVLGCIEYVLVSFKDDETSQVYDYSFKGNFTTDQLERISNLSL